MVEDVKMNSNDRIIVFEWKGSTFTVPEAEDPIVLPGGEILSVEKWGETFPEQPMGLKLMMKLEMVPGTDLRMVAAGMKGVLASAVIGEVYYACPKQCFNPSYPYCSVCGSKVEEKKVYVPVMPKKKQTPHVIDGVVDVRVNGPCPNCRESLDHDAQAAHCPNCGQALHWICR